MPLGLGPGPFLLENSLEPEDSSVLLPAFGLLYLTFVSFDFPLAQGTGSLSECTTQEGRNATGFSILTRAVDGTRSVANAVSILLHFSL